MRTSSEQTQGRESSALQGSPVAPGERYATLDVLRGFALLGVFLVNFVWFDKFVMATEAQLTALPTARIDHLVDAVVEWLVQDKANTLFAFLFGVGFSVQMQRLTARNAPFQRIYVRRLAILFAIGVVHLMLIWTWDILHVYALAGFVLFFLRNVSDRVLLGVGIALAFFGRPAVDLLLTALDLNELAGSQRYLNDTGALTRQALSQAGDYFGLVANLAGYSWYNWFAGPFLGWLLYALGRFMIGGWVGRQGYLAHPERHLQKLAKLLVLTLPAGLVLSFAGPRLTLSSDIAWVAANAETLNELNHALATPLIACGYACAIVLGLQMQFWRRMLMLLAPVGRMALTNYIMQSFVFAFVLFGVGPGLGLAGRIGSFAITLVVIGVFGLQILFSRWWLARFRYGPLEWAWRALTYRAVPDSGRRAAAKA